MVICEWNKGEVRECALCLVELGEVVKLEAVSCPVGRKIGRGGHVEGCIVPSWKKNGLRWSRWELHRTQLEEK